MSRLIKEKDVVKHAQKVSEIYEQDADYMVVGLGYIYSAPGAELELIRCSDCKYGELDMLDQGYMEPPTCEGIICTKHKGLHMDFTDYCSYGEQEGRCEMSDRLIYADKLKTEMVKSRQLHAENCREDNLLARCESIVDEQPTVDNDKMLEIDFGDIPRCTIAIITGLKCEESAHGCSGCLPKRKLYEAWEKQIPKKPIKLPESEQHIRYTDTYRCPTCGGNFSGTGVADYCYHCGQRLDWGEQE